MSITKYDPERWLETLVRGIKDYVQDGLGDLYEVVMEFPGAIVDASSVPLRKTLVHFEIDDQTSGPLGMDLIPARDNYDEQLGTIDPQYASIHFVNFDVGIWSSDASGGTTSRMVAHQKLFNLLGLPHGVEKLKTATNNSDGFVELLNFSGGNHVTDTVNDVRLYRMVGGELEVRVFSRTPISSVPSPAIEEILQEPNLSITD